MPETTGEKLERLRNALDLAQKTVAAKSGFLTRQNVSEIENGSKLLSEDELQLLLSKLKDYYDSDSFTEQRRKQLALSFASSDYLPPSFLFIRKGRKHLDADTNKMIESATQSFWVMSESATQVVGGPCRGELIGRILADCKVEIVILDPAFIYQKCRSWSHGDWCPGVETRAKAKRLLADMGDDVSVLAEELATHGVSLVQLKRQLFFRGWSGHFPRSLMIVDGDHPDSPSARCRAEMRLYKSRMYKRPNLLVTPDDEPWFETFVEQFRAIWKASAQRIISLEQMLEYGKKSKKKRLR